MKHYVLRFYVPVNNVNRVQVFETCEELESDTSHYPFTQLFRNIFELSQCPAITVIEKEKVIISRSQLISQLDNVYVIALS